MLHLYRTDVDAGIHGAIFSLLAGENKWGQRQKVHEIDRQLARISHRTLRLPGR
jgi:hypothetical protein